MSRSQRDKGARGEREAADLLRPAFPAVRRRCSGEESQSERGRDLAGTPGWCVQVAVGSRPPIERKFLEAEAAIASGMELPLALGSRRCVPWTWSRCSSGSAKT